MSDGMWYLVATGLMALALLGSLLGAWLWLEVEDCMHCILYRGKHKA